MVEYRFKPRILDVRPGGYHCDYGIDTIVRIYVAATLRDSLKSARVWIGGHDLRCNAGQGGGYQGSDSAGVNLYRWGGFGDYLGTGYNYDWEDSTGNITTQRDLEFVKAGWYYVRIEDSENCRAYDSIQLTEPDIFYGIVDSITKNLCGGGDEAIIHTIVEGGVLGYDFTWSKQLDPSFVSKEQSPTGLAKGTYILNALDTNGCYFELDTFVIDPARISPFESTSIYGAYEIACHGDSNGFIEIVYAEGGTGDWENFTYEWRTSHNDSLPPLETNIRLENIPAGDYYLTIHDSLGCYYSYEQPYEIREPSPIMIYDSISLYGGRYNVQCYDSVNGFIIVTDNESIRSTRHHYYTWSTLDGTLTEPNARSQIDLPSGTYWVDVEDEFNCHLSDTFTLIEPPELVLLDTNLSEYNGYNITCADSTTGWIAVQADGGFYHPEDPYSYDWLFLEGDHSPPAEDSISGLGAGRYILTVTDSLGCFRVDTIQLVEPDTLQVRWVAIDHNGVNITCFGLNDGEIDTTMVGGGVPGYAFSWSRSSDGWTSVEMHPGGLLPDEYTVRVSDENGCIAYYSDTLIQPDAPLVIGEIDTIIRPTCSGVWNGEIRLEPITGGTPAYTILWNTPTGRTTRDIDSIPSGTWRIEVWDLNQCYDSASYFVDEPLPFQGSIDTISLGLYHDRMISCYGEEDAVLGIEDPAGGTRPYSFRWYYGPDTLEISTDSVIQNRPIGYHRVIMTDKLGCEFTAEIIVTQPNQITSESFVEDAQCFNEPSGSINFHLAGGTPPYEYRWASGEMEANITDLMAGEYYVVAQDANQCIYDTSLVVDQPPPLELNDTSVAPGCPDSYDGYIELRPSGGVPPYSSFINGQSTNILAEIGPDEYALEVIDYNSCVTRDTIFIESDAETCLAIPTAFTPNADGYNDRWEIVGMEYYPEATVKIFNRWGDLIYEARNYHDHPWDGTYKGVRVPVDSYHYLISFTNGNKEITGYVTVIK
jgi:gliding motility-associated-like protein